MILRRIQRYVAYALIGVSLLALGGWYLFLRGEQRDLETTAQGRGFGLSEPSFGAAFGSTYGNVVATLNAPQAQPDTAPQERLRQVSKTPTAGFGFVATASTSALRFVERSSGYVLDADVHSIDLRRVSNTLVPRVYEALISRDGKVMRRTISESGALETSVSALATTSEETAGFLLPPGIKGIAFSPDGSELFAVQLNADGSSSGIRARWDGSGEKRLFTTAVSGWDVSWVPETVLLTQRSSDSLPGYAYEVGVQGALMPVERGVPGLTTLPRASSTALLWSRSDGALALFARVSETSSAVQLPIRTTADKCVWAPGSSLIAYCAVPQRALPADYLWQRHLGAYHSADSWWRVDVSAGEAELLYATAPPLDVENPAIDAAGEYIGFLNATDASLWLLRITEN